MLPWARMRLRDPPFRSVTPLSRETSRSSLSSVRVGASSASAELDLEAFRRREPEALGAFFEAYFDRVFGVARRLCKERATAEDLVQEVFLRVHRSAHRLDPQRDPAPWLMTITYNLYRDRLRDRADRFRKSTASIDAHPVLSASLTASEGRPDASLLARERERLVQAAILELPEDQRMSVLLRSHDGLSHSEIAEVLGMSEVAARKCYSRAIAALGRLLGEALS